MNFTQRSLMWVGISVGLVLAALFVARTLPSTDNFGLQLPARGDHPEISKDKGPASSAEAIDDAKTLVPTTQRVRHPFPELPSTRKGLPLDDDPFIATSREEQMWLDRNGYPNAPQWAALLQASDLQLKDAAAAGDRAAKALYDQRRLMAGDEMAIDSMLKDAAAGSTFALELLSSTLASKGDRTMGYAFSRVVEMRGNLRVGGARDVMFEKPLSQLERLEAEAEAKAIYDSLHQVQRSLKGPNSPASDPRPIGG